jgi:quercetin dioxygenase-like cupin family protein
MTTRMTIARPAACAAIAMVWWSMLLTVTNPLLAQAPGGCEVPVSKRSSEAGCYFVASEDLGKLPQTPLYWHLYNYPTRSSAEVAKLPHSTVVESFGKVWLYTIAESGWKRSGGERVAVIGPLPITSGKQYTTRYMEALFPPGMKGTPHRLSGPEAWYVLSGAQCLETPEGIIVAHAGESAMVREGPSMNIQGVGTETRHSVLLALHDSSQHWVTKVSDWEPKGLCPK